MTAHIRGCGRKNTANARMKREKDKHIKRIQLAAVTDDKYVLPLSVMLFSLLENHQGREEIDIYVLSRELQPQARTWLQGLVDPYGHSSIHFIQIPADFFARMPPNHFGHITEATFYRFAIPDLLPPEVSRVIYLDCDLIVEEDISILWKMDLEDKGCGAIAEYFPGIPEFSFKEELYRRLRLPFGQPYFNAGVLLMDLDLWRKNKWAQACMDFLIDYPERITFDDQDALNHVLRNHWVQLPARWNITKVWFRFEKELKKEGLFQSAEQPAIIHFTTKNKPWLAGCKHPYRGRFIHYWKQIPFDKGAGYGSYSWILRLKRLGKLFSKPSQRR